MGRRVTQAEFARICGVNRSTVHKWVKAGRISLEADGKLDLAKALKAREASESPEPHHQARKLQIEAEKAARRPAEEGEADDLSAADINRKLKYAAMKEREAKAAIAQMERDIKAGQLVRREDVERVLRDIGATLRGLMERLPDQLAAELAGYRGDANKIHAALADVARELLAELSDHMSRKKEQHL